MGTYFLLVLTLCSFMQVNSQTGTRETTTRETTTQSPCDPRIPDGPNCADYDDACTSPAKAKFCQRYCGLCLDVNAPSTIPITGGSEATTQNLNACVDEDPVLCPFRKNVCSSNAKVNKQCCATCRGVTVPTTVTTTTVTPSTTVTSSTTITSSTAVTSSTTVIPDSTTTAKVTSSKSPTKPTATPIILPKSTTKKVTSTPKNTKTITTTSSTAVASTDIPSTSNDTSNNETAPSKQPTTTAELVSKDTSTPSTAQEPTTTTLTPTTTTSFRVAVQVSRQGTDFIKIRIVALGFLDNDKLDTIISEVEKNLGGKVKDVTKIDVEDGKAVNGGDPVTILTLEAAAVPSNTRDSLVDDLEDDSSTFRSDLNNNLSNKDIELFNGQHSTEEESPAPNKATQRGWAEANWYILFAIGLAALIVVGLIIMAVTTASNRKRQKLQLQDKEQKLAYTKV